MFDACFDYSNDDLGPDEPCGSFDPWTRDDYEAAKRDRRHPDEVTEWDPELDDRRYDEHYDLNRKVSYGHGFDDDPHAMLSHPNYKVSNG